MWFFSGGLTLLVLSTLQLGALCSSSKTPTKRAESRKGRRPSQINIPENSVKMKIRKSEKRSSSRASSTSTSTSAESFTEPTQAERFEAIRQRLREQNRGNPQNFFSTESLPNKTERNALLVRIVALPYLFNTILRGIQFEGTIKSDLEPVEHVRVDLSLQTTIFGRILHTSICAMKRRLPHRVRSVLYQMANDVHARPDRLQYELVGHPQVPKPSKSKIDKKSKKLPKEVRKYFQEHEEMVPWITVLANCFIGLQLTDFAKQLHSEMENIVIGAGLQTHSEWRHATTILDNSIKSVHDRLTFNFHQIIYNRPEVQNSGSKYKPDNFRNNFKWNSLRENGGTARVNLSISTIAFSDIEKLVDL